MTYFYYLDGLSDPPTCTAASSSTRPCLRRHHGPERAAQDPPAGHTVLAMRGAESVGAVAAGTMKLVGDDVHTLAIPGVGHWLAEQAPVELMPALTGVLLPGREAMPSGGWT